MTPLNHFPATFTEPAAPRHAAAAAVVSPSSPSPSVDGRRLSRYSRSKSSSSSSSSSPSLPVAVTLTRTHTVPLRSPRASTTSHHRPGTHPPRAYLPFASLNAFTSIDPRPNSPPSASLATSTIANDSPASNSTSSSSSDHAATRVVVVVVVVEVVVHPLPRSLHRLARSRRRATDFDRRSGIHERGSSSLDHRRPRPRARPHD